jgi:epoxyqueuosine reductase
MLHAQILKEKALALGFNLVGITRAQPSPTLHAYHQWLNNNMHADMHYMARADRVLRRENLQAILPHAQTLIIVGMDYSTLSLNQDILQDRTRGRIANYAWGVDYHDVLTPKLTELAQWIQRETAHHFAVYVDTGAILERSHAQQAGLGFVGKNTMLISPKRGSYFFLGELLTTLECDQYDTAHKATMCGSCTRCLSACPTGAFPQAHVLDARLCISYHTIENKGSIPLELRSQFGNWVYGCDVCQEVCPFQRFATPTHEPTFFPVDAERIAPKLRDLLALDDDTFRQRFAQSPILRIKRERMIRNACVAAGNSGEASLRPYLERLLDDPSEMIKEHARWGLGCL